jgi:acylphosphatase
MRGGARADGMVARRLVIHGRVQGVGYRWAMVEAAGAVDAAGWVRNRRDGTVEAFVQGDAAVVDAVIAWCRRGPPHAEVTAVDVASATPDPAIADFRHRPSL